MISNALLCELQKKGIEYEKNFDLRSASSFRIGGSCALALFPDNAGRLADAVRVLDAADIPFCVLGRCSNTLFSDAHIDRVLVFTSRCDGVSIKGSRVLAEAGAGLGRIAALAAEACLGGFEFASGIPGSLGGAVYMNAGAYGSCMADVTASSRAYDRERGEEICIFEHGFEYRKSVYAQERLICLEAELCLHEAEAEAVRHEMHRLGEERRRKQPLSLPSAGSYFKRPDGDYAGRLIEACGLKGTRIGGAEVSQVHAGFIVNVGNASFSDVMRLEELVVNTVYKNFGVKLEREVKIID